MNIEHHLLRWSAWRRTNTGVPKQPICLIGKMIPTKADADTIDPLSDDEADRVNDALMILKRRYPKPYEAVMVRYKKGVFDDRKASKICRCSPASVKQWRAQGHTFLDGAIFHHKI